MGVSPVRIESTTSHAFARDTSISFTQVSPLTAQPPFNVPQYPGQLVALQTGRGTCKLYVGSDDQSRWLEVRG